MKVAIDETLFKGLEPQIELMEKITEQVVELGIKGVEAEPGGVKPSEITAIRVFHELLREVDPGSDWGGLRRVQIETGDYLWLCSDHYEVFEPGLPILNKNANSRKR
jgi:hypothetical protein